MLISTNHEQNIGTTMTASRKLAHDKVSKSFHKNAFSKKIKWHYNKKKCYRSQSLD